MPTFHGSRYLYLDLVFFVKKIGYIYINIKIISKTEHTPLSITSLSVLCSARGRAYVRMCIRRKYTDQTRHRRWIPEIVFIIIVVVVIVIIRYLLCLLAYACIQIRHNTVAPSNVYVRTSGVYTWRRGLGPSSPRKRLRKLCCK